MVHSFKYYCMALVLPLIATGEYGFTDMEAGGLFGMWGLLITVGGVLASVMVRHVAHTYGPFLLTPP